MKTKTLKNNLAVIAVLLAIAMFAIAGIVYLRSQNGDRAAAEDASMYNYTAITGENGETEYKIALKAAYRNVVKTAIVPDTYNGAPVTQLAQNAFISAVTLTSVTLPSSIKTIGNNAFMNCKALRRVCMAKVENIGSNAFALCPKLKGLYIPSSVHTVGASILKNNPNRVYVQRAADELGDGWQSTWASYFTGDVIYDAKPEDAIAYREILDSNGNAVGYELCEEQIISAADADITIYGMFRPDEDSPYLPVLNICSEAFMGMEFNSITIKAKPDDDPEFPVSDRKINIRSNAFYLAFVKEINIEMDATFDHPVGLVCGADSSAVGDAEGRSVSVFENSSVKSVTLPANITHIGERMFFDCNELSAVKIAGVPYDAKNVLPNVTEIGDEAFSSCVALENLTVPTSVVQMGRAVFDQWGMGLTSALIPQKQTINIGFYESKLPSGWHEAWDEGINSVHTTVAYRQPTVVTVVLGGGSDATVTLSAIEGDTIPDIAVPSYVGYTFIGVYSQPDGYGVEFHNADGKGTKIWSADDPTTLYAYAFAKTYTVTLNYGTAGGSTTVTARYGEDMPYAPTPSYRGYRLSGYYFPAADGTKVFYYNNDVHSARKWDIASNATLYA